MRNCKCGNEIPLWSKIDNKRRNLRSRKQCLACLPFLSSPYSKNEEERQAISKERSRRKQRKHYDKVKDMEGEGPAGVRRRKYKEKLVNILGGKCMICGYNKCVAALCFHHRNPDEKEFSLSKREMMFSFDRLLTEVMKCDLLCHNCHTETHEGMHN